MNIDLLIKDYTLAEELKKSELINKVTVIPSLEEVKSEYVLISDQMISYQDLPNINLTNKIVFYWLSSNKDVEYEKKVKIICNSRDIKLLSSTLVDEQIVNFIEKTMYPTKEFNTNVFSFFSPIGNVGTTTTTLSVAKALQKYTSAKIGVLLLNAYDDGTDQLNYKATYLDELKSKLGTQVIENDREFLSYFQMIEKDSLYILGGNRNTRYERMYTIDEIHYLIDLSKQAFDIVLIDCGSHFDNAVMVQVLHESDIRYLVLNQQPKSVKKFNYIYNDILYPLGYKKDDFLMIINSYVDQLHLPSSKDIYKDMEITMLTTLEKNDYGILAETEQQSLYEYDSPIYQEGIHIICKSITSHSSIEFEQHEDKSRNTIFKWRRK